MFILQFTITCLFYKAQAYIYFTIRYIFNIPVSSPIKTRLTVPCEQQSAGPINKQTASLAFDELLRAPVKTEKSFLSKSKRATFPSLQRIKIKLSPSWATEALLLHKLEDIFSRFGGGSVCK